MEKYIFIDYNRCVGCGTCEMVCSLVHEGICSPVLSRMRIVRYTQKGINIPVTCSFCEDPPCAAVCPSGAISKSQKTGEVLIDSRLCIGCRQCLQVCPFGHVNFNPVAGTAFKCDLCGGKPQCVEFCWTEALQYVDTTVKVDQLRAQAANNIVRGIENN